MFVPQFWNWRWNRLLRRRRRRCSVKRPNWPYQNPRNPRHRRRKRARENRSNRRKNKRRIWDKFSGGNGRRSATGRRNGGSPVTRTGRRMTDPGNAPVKGPAIGLEHAVDPRDETDRAAGREQGERVEINLQGITKFLFPELFANYLYNSEKIEWDFAICTIVRIGFWPVLFQWFVDIQMKECKGVVWGFSWMWATGRRFCHKTQKGPAECVYCVSGLRVRINFLRIQSGSRALMTKNWRKKLQLKKKNFGSKTTIYLSLGLHKERPSYRRSL